MRTCRSNVDIFSRIGHRLYMQIRVSVNSSVELPSFQVHIIRMRGRLMGNYIICSVANWHTRTLKHSNRAIVSSFPPWIPLTHHKPPEMLCDMKNKKNEIV